MPTGRKGEKRATNVIGRLRAIGLFVTNDAEKAAQKFLHYVECTINVSIGGRLLRRTPIRCDRRRPLRQLPAKLRVLLAKAFELGLQRALIVLGGSAAVSLRCAPAFIDIPGVCVDLQETILCQHDPPLGRRLCSGGPGQRSRQHHRR